MSQDISALLVGLYCPNVSKSNNTCTKGRIQSVYTAARSVSHLFSIISKDILRRTIHAFEN